METIRHRMSHEVWMISTKDNEDFLEEMVARFCDEEEAQIYADARIVTEYLHWEVRPCNSSHS